MDGSFSSDRVHTWLSEIADAAYVSLHYDDPDLGGVGGAEISGGGYGRFKMVFSEPANRAIWSLVDARFTGLTQNRLTHFGIYPTASQGILIASASLPERALILNGQGYVILAGDLSLSIG